MDPHPSPPGRWGSPSPGPRESGPDGRSDTCSASRMEVLEEFDSEFPQSVTFCQLISVEDFERQAVTYTERALRRLFRTLDRAPRLAERVLRKSKQAECEQRGLFSFLWAKFLSAVQGDLNLCNGMGAQEMRQRLKQLKSIIHRVHLYARNTKKKRRKLKLKKTKPILLKNQSTSPCLPPTLLPPPPLPSLPPPVTTITSVVAPSSPVYTMPRVFGPFLRFLASHHIVDLTPLVLNPRGFHFSHLPRNSPHKLHCPGFLWTSACSGSSSSDKTPTPACAGKASIFTPPVLLKFQPIPRPKDNSENSPSNAESKCHKRSP